MVIERCAKGLADKIDREIMEEYSNEPMAKSKDELFFDAMSRKIIEEEVLNG